MHAILRTVAGLVGFAAVAVDLPWSDWPPEPLPAPIASGPTVSIDASGPDVTLTFQGTLQSAPTAEGPWVDVPGADSPFREPMGGNPRFFRRRDPDGVFATNSVLSFTVTGPLQQHFDLALAGLPDGIFPPVRPKPYFAGQVRLAGSDVPVSLRVRGNSSLQECPFPKLKFKVAKEDRPGTPFAEAREVKIGTHCAEGGQGSIGRLRDERAAYREALAYDAMQVLGFVTPRVRRARIRYADTSPTNAVPDVGWQVTRGAVIVEDIEVLAERIGGRALDESEVSALRDANFDAQLIADLRCFHVLLGNWDFALSPDGRGLWNTEAMALPEGIFVPVAGDFDLASWVTESVLESYPHDYLPDLPAVDRRARYELEQVRKLVSPGHFAASRERLLARRIALSETVAAALVDEAGRTNVQRHIAAFYDALIATGR